MALATVVVFWFTTQLVFALHYAHKYYAPDVTTPDETDVVGGLQFPHDPAPDYWDFLHFAVVLGAATQTADVAFTNKALAPNRYGARDHRVHVQHSLAGPEH